MSSFDEWWTQAKYDIALGLHEGERAFAERAARLAWHEARKQAFREATAEIKRYERETFVPMDPGGMVCSRVRSKVASLEQRESEQRITHEDKESIREETDNG